MPALTTPAINGAKGIEPLPKKSSGNLRNAAAAIIGVAKRNENRNASANSGILPFGR